MNEKDRLYLGHIAECIERIEDYTKTGRDQFMESHLIQDGVIRNFEIIGEAVKRLSDQVLENTQDIPWHQIAGFRNLLIHGYMDVDLKQVWNVIEQYLPDLKKAVEYLLK